MDASSAPAAAADDHHFDHGAWIDGLMRAATGRAGRAADEALALRRSIDDCVATLPSRLLREARALARSGGGGLVARVPDATPPLTATLRAERERTWIAAAVGPHHLTLSVEPLAGGGRTGVVHAIGAPSGIARDALSTLSRNWGAFSRREDVHGAETTTSGDARHLRDELVPCTHDETDTER